MSWLKKLWKKVKEWFDDKPLPEPPPDEPEEPPLPPPPPPAEYIVRAGQRIEKSFRVPCALEFSITGKLPAVEDGGPRDNTHLAWAWEQAWHGGNPQLGQGFVAGLRDYALKVYHASGAFAGQNRYSIVFDPARTYRVRLEVGTDRTRALIDGVAVAAVDATGPRQVTLGYGWPPEQRPGPEGAKITNVKYEGEAV